MRLKALELHGYKTFASRTLFEFAGTVTAIVGPNGSGKSNIADSLRWVLGEQSFSLLRGKKTEDMIFAGSEHRPRSGMASATLTFDNSDGWLPIDFGEVAVTRRAYRDGQNEYLLNGQRVRLKDVSELFAQSGLAERTYTIIGQGLVDAALALKAEERRRLFEEAAGIGLHRSRREEALRRLEVTKRNLERVEDILAELQPRLRSLERQARRAQEYEQVKADLRVVLRDWYGYHWHRAMREQSEARDVARSQELLLDKARQEQAQIDEQLGVRRDRAQSLRASLNSWHRQSAQLHTQREALSRDLAVAAERMRALADQQQGLQREQARLEEELGLQGERCAAAGQEVERLQVELAESRTQVEAARRSLAARQAERAAAEKELQAARQAQGALNARQGQLQARLAERRAQAERSQKALAAASEAVKAAEQELQAAEARSQAARQAQEAAEVQRKEADEVFSAHRRRLVEVEAARKEALDQRTAASTEVARLKAQLDVLEQAENSLTGYAGGTRLLLQAARQAKLKNALGALSSVLDVPAELETAIAAALGEYLDAVLLSDDPEQALDLLTKETTRGVLLPLRALKPPTPLNLPAGESINGAQNGGVPGNAAGPAASNSDVLGLASDLVRVSAELRPAIDLLLGQALVVRDRKAARRALAALSAAGELPHPSARAVTLRGEVFYASGPVLAGSSSASGGQTVLGRSRQRRELGQALAQARSRLTAAGERVDRLEAELKALQVEGDRLGQAQRNARQSAEKAALAANQARLAAEQAARQARWQQEQRNNQQAEIARGAKEMDEATAELARLEAEISQARERVRTSSAALAALTLDELQANLGHWNTQAAVAERALTDGRARQRERQAALDQAQRQQTSLVARLAEITQTLEGLETEKATRRQAEGAIGEQIEALRTLIDPAEAELEALEQEITGLQTTETSTRQALSTAEHNVAQTKITLARRQEALQSLRRRIEEDFGLVAFEYTDEVSGPTPLPLEGMVEQLPRINQLSPEVEEIIKRQRAQLRRMGPVNPEAQAEYQEVRQRHAFLTEQVADLQQAEVGVRQVISELDGIMQREFRKTFDAVAVEFKTTFTRLFGGGTARLILTDPEDLTGSGIDIEARLPGRRAQGLSLLSGGERSLTAVALVFSLLKVSPTPFCVLDEVDAMLDEANVGRFRDLLRELSQNIQFVVVTHNRNTVQVADIIYGITMGRDSASQVVSLKLDEVDQVVE